MLTCIVDLQYGSTGKGLLAGYLSQKRNYDVVVSANMPNAGHTFVDSNGLKWVNKVLPSGVYSPQLEYICVGPGAVFCPNQLAQEIEELRARTKTNSRIVIHPDAAILLDGHKSAEKSLSGIASTMQGSMEAAVHKMRRHVIGSNVASHCHSILVAANVWDYVVTHEEWNNIMLDAKSVLVEGSQGYSLGMNSGFYPYCTSRDCSVWRLISDAGVIVPYDSDLRIIGSARVHPIRVGNTPDGNSGDYYPDQKEISWEELGVEPEYTTVTKRVRRVFTFSHRQIHEAILANRCDEVFLNFCNYNPRESIEIKARIDKWYQEHRATNHPFAFAGNFPPLVRYLGFGPQAEDVLDTGWGQYTDGASANEPV